MAKKTYTFGEKEKEFNPKTGAEVSVWKSPKYIEAKEKAIETLESDMYKGILEEGDFWILTTLTKSGKVAYTGLIISHNGCLKINDVLPKEKKFAPSCVSLDKDGYNGSLVYSYCNDSQGIYEVGEVSSRNCKNDYPYAMALKRCMDRVILKNSKLAYSGIYSDSEADEFKNEPDEKKVDKKETAPAPVAEKKEEPKEEPKKETAPVILPELPEGTTPRKALVDYCNNFGINVLDVAKTYKLNNTTPDLEFMRVLGILIELNEGGAKV